MWPPWDIGPGDIGPAALEGWRGHPRDGLADLVPDEGEAFAMAFGYVPREGQRATSPFREDRRAGCSFWRSPSGVLLFTDHAEGRTMDCLDAVRARYGLPDRHHALELVRGTLGSARENIEGAPDPVRCTSLQGPNGSTEMAVWARPYRPVDKRYWERYGITEAQLEGDGVLSVERYAVTKNGKSRHGRVGDALCYACTQFFGTGGERRYGRAKLYWPLRSGGSRFLSNCTAADIGGLEGLVDGEGLVVSKSYKDCRVLRNMGVSAVWFQNEGMLPSTEALYHLGRGRERVTVLFDSDAHGIRAARKVAGAFNDLFPGRAGALWLPEGWRKGYGAKDPADVFRKMGAGHLAEFLRGHGLVGGG